jgi:hypothetical protein
MPLSVHALYSIYPYTVDAPLFNGNKKKLEFMLEVEWECGANRRVSWYLLQFVGTITFKKISGSATRAG